MGVYMVTAPLVIATAENGSLHHVYQGSPMPAFIGQDELDRLAADGMIAAVEEAEPVTPADPPVVEAPKGNASRDEWAAYAATKGAPEEETKSVDEGGLKQTELRDKYGN